MTCAPWACRERDEALVDAAHPATLAAGEHEPGDSAQGIGTGAPAWLPPRGVIVGIARRR